MTTVILTSGTSYVSAVTASAQVDAIGGGGSSQSAISQCKGGGGGEWRMVASFALNTSTSYPYAIGAGGTAQNDGGNTSWNTSTVIANGGKSGYALNGAGGTGGTGAGGNNNGGAAGTVTSRGSGGGGAGGPKGVGGAGGPGNQTGNALGGAGDTGSVASIGGSGGPAGGVAGTAGGAGSSFSTAGAGGGGGGTGYVSAVGGTGGAYGGGGGGSFNAGSAPGFKGLIVLTFTGGGGGGNPFINLFENPVSKVAAAVAFVALSSQVLGTPIGYPSGKPLSQNDWPNPGLRTSPWQGITSQPQGRLTALLPSFIQPPLNNYDWPNPTRAALNITAQTSQKAGMPFGYLSSDAPFAQRNWPNPILAPYGFQRTTSQPLGRITALLPVFIQAPLNQYNWPNPVLRLKAFDTQPLGSPLIDCTLNGKGLKPFAQTQWPNPRGPKFFAVPLIVNYPSIFRSDGQPPSPWTPVTPVTVTWTAQSPSTDIWTPQVPGSDTWTPQ